MSSHIRCRTAAEIARDGDFITKGCGVDEMATFMLCQRSIHVTFPRDTLDGTMEPFCSPPLWPRSIASEELWQRACTRGDGRIRRLRWTARRHDIERSAAVPLPCAGSAQKDTARTGAPGGSRLPRSKCMRGMARRLWLAGWASHRLELTATSPLIDLCTPVGKHTRGRPGKSRSCDGQGRRSVVTDKAGDHVTQHDARPALARSAPTHQAPVGYSPRGVSARAFFVRDLIRSRGGFKTPSG